MMAEGPSPTRSGHTRIANARLLSSSAPNSLLRRYRHEANEMRIDPGDAWETRFHFEF